MLWLLMLLGLVIKVNSEPSGNFNYNISVRRYCDRHIERESIVAPALSVNLSKNITCNKMKGKSGKVKMVKCNCDENTTFVAVNRTCIGNEVLRRSYGKY